MREYAREHVSVGEDNIEITLDYHWVFLNSRDIKERENVIKHNGKWKFDAASGEALIRAAEALIPFVADGRMQLVKFTNLPNVYTGQRALVGYSFPHGFGPWGIGELMKGALGSSVYWGSERFKEPEG